MGALQMSGSKGSETGAPERHTAYSSPHLHRMVGTAGHPPRMLPEDSVTTDFDITASTDRVVLDASQRGQVTFTVTNTGSAPRQAALTIVPGGGAAASWFGIVGDSQRLIPTAGSADFQVRIA